MEEAGTQCTIAVTCPSLWSQWRRRSAYEEDFLDSHYDHAGDDEPLVRRPRVLEAGTQGSVIGICTSHPLQMRGVSACKADLLDSRYDRAGMTID
ncbi:MAG: hypothetical protein A2Z30_08305 [Chloroflexi bacterium RBG_16_64_43]|nr:MAG: hypothetical protein A2Z30_08305 [Chloroflexi bacterium RBG_16_64_43]